MQNIEAKLDRILIRLDANPAGGVGRDHRVRSKAKSKAKATA